MTRLAYLIEGSTFALDVLSLTATYVLVKAAIL
jgi:hypothetical protein